MVLRAFGGGVEPALGGVAVFRREKVLAVYEDGGAAGEAEPVVGAKRHRYDLGRETLLRDHPFQDVQGLRKARIYKVRPLLAIVLDKAASLDVLEVVSEHRLAQA